MFTFDERRTEQRIAQLQNYYERNVLDKQRFVCASYSQCMSSIGSSLNFYNGQLSHVGKKYDIQRNGQDLRIVVTGISYGHEPSMVDMNKRYQMVVDDVGMKTSLGGKNKRNPHMTGTTLLLKRILLGQGSLKNWTSWDDEFIDLPRITDNHIFNLFALINLLLCSACVGTEDKSSRTMCVNCFKHYMETLRILEPTLVIFQGKNKFENVLKASGMNSHFQNQDDIIGYFEENNLKFLTCNLCHPSTRNKEQNWGRSPEQPYFQNVVLPALAKVGF